MRTAKSLSFTHSETSNRILRDLRLTRKMCSSILARPFAQEGSPRSSSPATFFPSYSKVEVSPPPAHGTENRLTTHTPGGGILAQAKEPSKVKLGERMIIIGLFVQILFFLASLSSSHTSSIAIFGTDPRNGLFHSRCHGKGSCLFFML